jgi:hypothetical protein
MKYPTASIRATVLLLAILSANLQIDADRFSLGNRPRLVPLGKSKCKTAVSAVTPSLCEKRKRYVQSAESANKRMTPESIPGNASAQFAAAHEDVQQLLDPLYLMFVYPLQMGFAAAVAAYPTAGSPAPSPVVFNVGMPRTDHNFLKIAFFLRYSEKN